MYRSSKTNARLNQHEGCEEEASCCVHELHEHGFAARGSAIQQAIRSS